MLANAEQAIKTLRHKRTGEILPSKTIARNTKLVYFHDDLIGLRFHDTIVAKYLRDGVLIDTRDRWNANGWFTTTTWSRIDEFTPARTFSRNGLRHVIVDPAAGASSARLYAHGTFVSPNGSCKIPMDPATSDAILHVRRNWPAKVKRYAEQVAARWREWAAPTPCCERHIGDAETWLPHLAQHIRANEYVVPPNFEHFISGRDPDHEGDALVAATAENFAEFLRKEIISVAIKQIDPNFPYPQLTTRR